MIVNALATFLLWLILNTWIPVATPPSQKCAKSSVGSRPSVLSGGGLITGGPPCAPHSVNNSGGAVVRGYLKLIPDSRVVAGYLTN